MNRKMTVKGTSIIVIAFLILIGGGIAFRKTSAATPEPPKEILIPDQDEGNLPVLLKENLELQQKMQESNTKTTTAVNLLKAQKKIGDNYSPMVDWGHLVDNCPTIKFVLSPAKPLDTQIANPGKP